MDPAIEAILSHEPDGHGSLAGRVAALTHERQLWDLMSAYDWDEGFEIPLAVVTHPRCDRGLALRLYWELDDTARIHHSNEENALRELYSAEAEYDPEGFALMREYCTALVGGLRAGTFPVGRNSFDTGFFGLDGASLTERRRRIRAAHTRRAQREHEDGFLHPVEGIQG